MKRAARLRSARAWHLVDRLDFETVVSACGESAPRSCWQVAEDGRYDCSRCERIEQRRICEARSTPTLPPADPRRAEMAVWPSDESA